jgi:hypothetical protein
MTGTEATLRAFFFTEPAEAGAALGTAVRSGGAADEIGDALGRMPRAAKEAVLAEIGERAADVLDLGLADIFQGVWGKHAALRRAAVTTLAHPDTEELVELATYNVSFDDQPSIEVHIADLPVATVEVRVELEITVRGLVAVVRNGRLTAIRAGSGEVNGTLSIAGQQVTEQQATINLPAAIRLRGGIPLANPDDAPPSWHHRDF